MPTYPLPTLGPTITAAGITIPSYNDIYTSLQASAQAIYGSDVYLDPDSQDGQMLAIYAKAYNDQNNAIVTVYNSFSPSYAQGVLLSLLVRINGLTRDVATNSSVYVTLTGNSDAVVTNGVVQDTQGNLWNLPASVTITDGSVSGILATAQQVGAINVGIGTVTTIFTPQLGWTGVTNPAASIPGAPVETDAALRIRQAGSVSLPASSPLGAIYAAIGEIPGVTQWTVYENNSAITDTNGVPSHSISVIVLGGNSTTIAEIIQLTKSEGTGTYGTTSVVVTDPQSGLPITINFYILVQVPIYVSVSITGIAAPIPPDSAVTQAIQNAIAASVSGLAIGEDVYYSQLYPPAQLDNIGPGSTYYVTSLTVGTTASPIGTSNIVIPFNKVAYCLPGNVTVTPS
jgi:uncharacterized phage protein gp47/JayE